MDPSGLRLSKLCLRQLRGSRNFNHANFHCRKKRAKRMGKFHSRIVRPTRSFYQNCEQSREYFPELIMAECALRDVVRATNFFVFSTDLFAALKLQPNIAVK